MKEIIEIKIAQVREKTHFCVLTMVTIAHLSC